MKATINSYSIKELPIMMAMINTDGVLVEATKKWAKFYGFKGDSFIGLHLTEIFKGEQCEQQKEIFEDVLKGIHKQGICDHKEHQYFKWDFSPWLSDDMELLGTVLKIEDITQELQTNLKYDKLDNLLNIQSEISKVGIWEYDMFSKTITWSKTTKDIYDVPLDFEPTVENFIKFYDGEEAKESMKNLYKTSAEIGITWHKTMKINSAKGVKKHIITACRPITQNKKVVKLVGTVQDVSEQVNAKIQIVENEKLLRTLIDSLPASIYIKDLESRKVMINQQECKFFNKTEEEILGKNDFDLFEPELAKILRKEDLDVMESKEPMLGKRFTYRNATGESLSFLTSKLPLLDIKGRVKGLIGISLDISDVVSKEAELQELIKVTAVQNKKLLNFAHIVSHNIRSHSANFTMLLNFLNIESDGIEKQRLMDMLTETASKLSETLEHLNEVLEINANLKLENEPINLYEATIKALNNLRTQILDSDINVKVTIDDTIVVQAVPQYLENIITQFISNSIKYRHPDKPLVIDIKSSITESKVLLNVTDNGLGFDIYQHQDKLFGMYKTFHDNPDAKGIGLFIAKNQAEAMGAKLAVCSEINEGATFSIIFKHGE
ncbi:PAS domain-containing protein [Flavobacterium sp. ASW18X]|uniref:PAS domain-containing protein n=1 Tax=Flavobacterium sp. ASW18X TaxID=2572595 RepID=UPI0010AE6954|nr:PAS domain-containing protein [Flavobacterium sp. ASW18X]TKD59053.1 PAS domain S-box protein [Flavobacterium sp. ASW18X]